ncbi:FAD/NAD(P)-binding domain-containing protein [Melanomma pulvis-pyrius CBS 109.77]|uniref:FAD/NAD(P)-binding domain-containing protein n=1 Tax=Melanomma pulvis-pyrius CBS 109.77 TaxID=1314802 RepID=A0A6A6XH98_9PLEO|nr:FAD/NAD(P)-binding domain-containing protein [Melanomma pulvis-pyrius CBS 109.77]
MSPKVIIIGAGWAGLSAARTYIIVNPEVDLTILDDDSSVGGVWSASRLYPGLIADSPRGLFEYSDMSMLEDEVFASSQKRAAANHGGMHVKVMGERETETLDKKEMYGLLKGEETNSYLQKYAEKWDLIRRTRLKSKVIKAERIPRGEGLPTGWRVILSSGEILDCDKLVVATGLYSTPSTPEISGADSFIGFSTHSKLLGREHHRLSDPNIKSITVIGGCKSAMETLNLCLALPTKPHIDWIIRGSEHGVPIIMNDPSGPISLLALNCTRLFSAISPSIFDTESWMYRFFHSGRNWFGTWLCSCFWSLLTWSLLRDAGYDKSEQGKMIKPKVDNLFQSLLYVSLIHKGNPVMDELHAGQRIKVHVGELDHVTPSRVVIRKKTTDSNPSDEKDEINSNAIIWCTGFKASTSFFSPEDTISLGLPVSLDSELPEVKTHWDDLLAAADTELLKTFPALKKWPLQAPKERTTNYRMYRQVIPPSLIAENDRSIAFIGFVSNGQTAFASELTGLYGVAWLEGMLRSSDFPSLENMEADIAKTHAWMARRYGARGHSLPEVVLEVQTFFDVLVRDLGAEIKRKGGWREYLGVYTASDYKGLLESIIEKSKKRD